VGLPAETFAASVERSVVSPAALGTGYTVFFGYTALTGIFAIILALIVLRRQPAETMGAAMATRTST
jgi:PAT family beta-lactamase induction signal transducer AmpG